MMIVTWSYRLNNPSFLTEKHRHVLGRHSSIHHAGIYFMVHAWIYVINGNVVKHGLSCLIYYVKKHSRLLYVSVRNNDEIDILIYVKDKNQKKNLHYAWQKKSNFRDKPRNLVFLQYPHNKKYHHSLSSLTTWNWPSSSTVISPNTAVKERKTKKLDKRGSVKDNHI